MVSASGYRGRRIALMQRQLALGALALLGGVAALAIVHERKPPALPATLKPVPAPGGGWYSAFAAAAAIRGPRATPCGHIMTRLSVGVAHPVLPCDVKLFIRFGDRTVLTQVIDRGPYVPGRAFEMTPELAHLLGLHGTQPIRWRFAR